MNLNDQLPFSIKKASGTSASATPLSKLLALGGLSFYKNFEGTPSSLDADYSLGSKTAVFSVARTGAGISPGTYTDAAGNITTQAATDNTPRYTYGYYNDKGFIAYESPGILLEDQKQNLAKYSSVFDNAQWVDVNNLVTQVGGYLSPSAAKNEAYLITMTAGDNRLSNQCVSSHSLGVIYNASIWLRADSPVVVQLMLVEGTAPNLTILQCSVDTVWRRFNITRTSTGTSNVYLQLSGQGDGVNLNDAKLAATFYAFGAQVEVGNQPSTYIPNSGATQNTRNLESLKYACSGNRTPASESIVITYTPQYFTYSNVFYLLDNDTDRRYIKQQNLDNTSTPSFKRHLFNPSSVSGTEATGSAFKANTKNFVGVTFKASDDPNTSIFENGFSILDQNTDFTAPDMGTNFYLAGDNAGANHIRGVIHSIAIFNNVLSDSNMLAANKALGTLPDLVAVVAKSEIVATTGLLAENIVFDSVTGKYWMVCTDTGGAGTGHQTIRMLSASSITGTWTLQAGNVIANAGQECYAPFIIKIASTWYIFYSDGASKDVMVQSSSSVNSGYGSAATVVSNGGAGEWDENRASEPMLVLIGSTYFLIYMGESTPALNEKVGYALSSSPTSGFTKYPLNPPLAGDSANYNLWDHGQDKAADPCLITFDNGINYYLGVAATDHPISKQVNRSVGFFKTQDFVTFSPLKWNPILSPCGKAGNKNANGAFRGHPYVDTDGTIYYPYTMQDDTNTYRIGIGRLYFKP